jgi:hypothetical protein
MARLLRRLVHGQFVGFPERAPGYKAGMDNVARVRRASIKVAKVQRRFWLLQTIFWPVVVVAGIVAVVAVGGWVWQRRKVAVETKDVVLASPNGSGPTDPAQGRLNGASSGNLSD